MLSNKNFDFKIVAQTSVFTALVFGFTVIFTIATPATNGFFNVGEAGVYLAAIIGGPIVGAIAGGLGSAMADIFLGYAHYAPGTLIIKGLEGFITGFLFRKLREIEQRRRFIYSTVIIMLFSIFVAYLAIDGVELSLVLYLFGSPRHFSIFVPFVVIILLLAILDGFVVFSSWKEDLSFHVALASFIGGIEMVLGYFLYEAFILGYGLIAVVEIPVNIGQVIFGILIVLPVIKTLSEMGYNVDREEL